MKLSEAIRQGATIRPQAFGEFATRDATGQVCTCALGAAYETAAGKPPPTYGSDIQNALIMMALMDTYHVSTDLLHRVGEMNDAQHLTREEIAAWLEERGL